ncbi:MAG: hypothetical protein R3F37_18065 [Candidatus Competibacteraceae bacterium]
MRARDLAVEVVERVRRLLPKGPFNNRGPQPVAGVLHDDVIEVGQLPPAILARSQYPRAEDLHGDIIVGDGLDALAEFHPSGAIEDRYWLPPR